MSTKPRLLVLGAVHLLQPVDTGRLRGALTAWGAKLTPRELAGTLRALVHDGFVEASAGEQVGGQRARAGYRITVLGGEELGKLLDEEAGEPAPRAPAPKPSGRHLPPRHRPPPSPARLAHGSSTARGEPADAERTATAPDRDRRREPAERVRRVEMLPRGHGPRPRTPPRAAR